MKPTIKKFHVVTCIVLGLAGFIFCLFYERITGDHSVSIYIRVTSAIINLVAWWLFAAFLAFVVPRIRKQLLRTVEHLSIEVS